MRTHRADIDGLRAVAILGVLAYHFGLGVPGGYGGVDVFFVISGFLIAGIIKRELEAGTFSLANFYVRRIRRILPALTVCLAVTTAAAVVILFPMDIKDYGRSLLSAAFSISNFYFAGRRGYFDSGAMEKPLVHTWSLAVEEQFYIVFPLTLLLLFRFARKWVLPALAAITALSLAYSWWIVMRWPEPAFFSTFGRAWELGVGVLVAFGALPVLSRRWAIEATAIAGVLLIAFSFFFYDSDTPFPGLAAIPLCLGAALVIHAGTGSQASAVARVLSLPPMVGIGLISYSVYLWHWPLVVFGQYRFPEVLGPDAPLTTAAHMGLAIASIVIGAVSWRIVEEPFRRAKGIAPKLVFIGGGAAVLGLGAAAGLVIKRPYLLHRWPEQIDAMQFRRTVSGADLGLQRMPGWSRGSYLIGKEGSMADTVLWGDSFGQALIPGFMSYHEKTGRGVVIAANAGCPPLLGVAFYRRSNGALCKPLNDKIFKSITSDEIRRVILIASWSGFAKGVVRDSNGNPAVYGKHGNADGTDFAVVLETLVRRLLAQNKDVVIVGPIPSQSFDVAPAVARHVAWGTPLPAALGVAQFKDDEGVVLSILARLATIPHVRVVYPHLSLCDANVCRYSVDGKPMYSDNDHLSPTGVATLSGMFDEIFAADTTPQAASVKTSR